MIITIARECGCKGDKIGMALAEKYGLPFYNKKAISQLAKEKGNYEKFPDFYGEIPVDTLLYSISLAEEDGRLYQTPQKALAPVIGKEDCIILGRCGNYVFRDRDDVFSVFLTGDIAWREENIAKKHDVLYGKFFAKKAGFISKKWLPVFANYRRDGYDFDALFEDEKVPIKHKNIMDHFMENDAEIYSYELKKLAGFGKDGEKGFDGAITSLMMQTYLCNCDFRKRINQKGVEYGWDVAVYSSPEHIYGYDHVTSCYKEDPRTSWGKIVDHMKQLYPEAADTQIRKILK